jgi:hypothetical protein
MDEGGLVVQEMVPRFGVDCASEARRPKKSEDQPTSNHCSFPTQDNRKGVKIEPIREWSNRQEPRLRGRVCLPFSMISTTG